eukprot:scaffold25_cov342-Pavlova_lutheri.AAC.34
MRFVSLLLPSFRVTRAFCWVRRCRRGVFTGCFAPPMAHLAAIPLPRDADVVLAFVVARKTAPPRAGVRDARCAMAIIVHVLLTT